VCPSESGTEVGAPIFPAVELCDFSGRWQCMSGEIWYTINSSSVISEITVNNRAMDSSKQAQRAVIQFLSAEGVSATDIYGRVKNVYGTECMSRTAVFRWCSDFRHGRVSTVDMPRPSQAHVVITQESISAVNSLVRENRRITTQEIADSLSVSKGTVDTILHEHLN